MSSKSTDSIPVVTASRIPPPLRRRIPAGFCEHLPALVEPAEHPEGQGPVHPGPVILAGRSGLDPSNHARIPETGVAP